MPSEDAEKQNKKWFKLCNHFQSFCLYHILIKKLYLHLSIHRILDHRTVLSDDLPNRIITGRVQIKPNVKEFTSTSVIFEDGTEESTDVVIFATGYILSFPFLHDEPTVLDSQYSMFKFVFPPGLEKPTLAFIGIVQPAGAIIPTSELQSRWVVQVFTGMY